MFLTFPIQRQFIWGAAFCYTNPLIFDLEETVFATQYQMYLILEDIKKNNHFFAKG